MKVTLTGAAGRLGAVMLRRLVEAGHDVRATDVHYRTDLPVPVEVHDLLEREAAYRLLAGAEALVHMANHPGLRGPDGQRTFNENVNMNMHVFEAARQCGVKTIIFASTIQVFTGWRAANHPEVPSALPYLPLDGALPPNPGNLYALSKQASEIMLQYYAKQHGMSCIAVRWPLMISPEWMERFLKKEQNRETGPWGSNLDEAFTYLPVTDAAVLVEAMLKANLPGYRCYFPTRPDPRVPGAVPDLLRQYFGTVPLRQPLEQMTSFVDISRITRETGWTPAPLPD